VRSHAMASPVGTGRAGAGSIVRRAVIAGAMALLILCVQAGRAAAAECSNEDLRTEKSVLLPDCRAYEQVSPSDKQTSAATFYREPFLALASHTDDGSVVFSSHEPMPGSASGTLQNEYWATRGASGWSYKSLAPTIEVLPGALTLTTFRANSDDLKYSLILAQKPSLALGAAPEEVNLYLRNNETEKYELLSTTQGVGAPQIRAFFSLAGASSDYSRIIFTANVPLLPEAPAEPSSGLYEYHDGQLSLVGILPNGEPAQASQVSNPNGGGGWNSFNSVSEDGSRVYFGFGLNLFVRVNGSRTVEVSKDHRTTPEPEPNFAPSYWGASTDGDVAYISSLNNLTNDANTGRDAEGHPLNSGENLYRFDLGTEELTDLTVDSDPPDAETGAQVEGVTGVSDDGSTVYFVALGNLAAGAHRGEPNLYLWHNGVTRYIATLSGADAGDWTRAISSMTSRISPDGNHLLFASAARLTGYDNTDATTNQPDTELYLYSAHSSSLECISCNPDGSRPNNSTTLTTQYTNGAPESSATPNYMSEDGSTVAFVTSEALVPRDTNRLPDIYEYRNGQVALISTGTSEFAAEYADMSPDGKDLYFSTTERLTKSDVDNFGDLYDARSGGGFGISVAATFCSGVECERQIGAQQPALPLSSQVLGGRGNVRPAKKKGCGKGKRSIKQGGKTKCVKKQPQGSKRHQKGHRGASPKKGDSK
jgi:hypothetical protein